MLRIDFITLFPDMMQQAVSHSIIGRAARNELVEFGTCDPREFTQDKHRTVDEKPYGGGPGMLMKPEPVYAALQKLKGQGRTAVVMTDPTGKLFKQHHAEELAGLDQVVFLCGHYEGIDHRISKLATHIFSIGDFVLTGGELPALVMMDAIVRTLPGALGCGESLGIDSHSDGLLSSPQYTRPDVFLGEAVPEVLKSGDHGAVERWKRQNALKLTREHRPDLFCRAKLEKRDLDLLSS